MTAATKLGNCPCCQTETDVHSRNGDNWCEACGFWTAVDKWNALCEAAAKARAWVELKATVAQNSAETGETTRVDIVDMGNRERKERAKGGLT